MNGDKPIIFIYRTMAPVIVVAILLMASCSSQPTSPPSTPTPTESHVEIILKEFTLEPDLTTINTGVVIFEVKNDGFIEHNFIIEGIDEKIELIFPQESETLELELLPGEYKLVCTLPGHEEAGMVSEITVQ